MRAQVAFQSLAQLPWVMLALASLPLLVACLLARTYPTRRWVGCLIAMVVCSVIVVFVPVILPLLFLFDGLLFAITAIDFGLVWWTTGGRHGAGIAITRQLPQTCSIGVPIKRELTLENRTALRLRGEVMDDIPDAFESQPMTHGIDLQQGMQTTVTAEVTPQRRGKFELHAVYCKLLSPLSLWQRHLRLPVNASLNVYPDMKQMSDYAMLARTNRLSLIGVRRTRRIGQDSDFERLRDYSRDDNYRHIDWRCTARRNKLTVRQFQSDQSQRLMLMLDCGRMMTNERAGYSLLDHALNASLMMAYVALHQGDAVGMLCFSDRIHAYIPPRGGASQMNRLLQASFNQFPRMVESRYDQAFLYLTQHCQRRSMVTLTTNIIDEVNAEVVSDHLRNLTGTHLPLAILIRDREMFDAADQPAPALTAVMPNEQSENHLSEPSDFQWYRAAAAADLLVWRHEVLNQLRHRGVLIVDAFPEELTAPMINQYLEVKAKHLL
ncbi:MAG: DUF58 domain-containing protein [Planctomycetota bacterium]